MCHGLTHLPSGTFSRASSVLTLRGVPLHVSRVLTRRSTVAVIAVGAMGAATLPAGAATTTTTTPSHGKASSTLTIVRLKIGGQSVSLGRISAVAGTLKTPHTAALTVTPIAYDFPAVGKSGSLGQQTITPANGSVTVPTPPASIALPNGLGSVIGPSFTAHAKDGAAAVLAAAKLSTIGKVTLAGVPLDLRLASLGNLAQVVSTNATADKTLSIGDLSLPSVNDLLAGLGLDISRLTQDQLTQLAGVVGTVSSAISTLNTQIDTLQTQVAGAPATLAAGDAAVTTATSALQTQLDALNAALQDPTTGAAPTALLTTALTTAGLSLPTVPITLPAWSAFSATLQNAIATFSDATLSTTLAAANTALDQAQQLVTDLTSLLGLVTGALDADPIASLGGVKLTTKAVAARTPHAVSTLSVASVDVLGQASALSALSGAVDTLGSTLASVLNSVPGVTFVPPSISVGTPSHSTKTVGRTRFANASVTGVTLTLPTLDLSGAGLPLALPGGLSASGSLVLGQLTEGAQWTPPISHTTTSTSGSPVPGGGQQLGDTGGRVLLPILATIVLGVAVAVRRRWSAA